MSEAQESALVEYALKRIDSLKQDNQERIRADREAQKAYDNSRKDRQDMGGVWLRNNLVLPLTSMICESFVSRAEDDLLGEDPYFAFRPQGAKDDSLATECDAYFRYKFGERQAKLKTKLEDGLLPIFLRRAAVFKAIWDEDKSEWLDGSTNILWDKTKKKPVRIMGADGDPRYVNEQEAQWDETVEPDGSGGQTAKSTLRADPSVVWDDQAHEFAPPPKAMMREKMRYLGANVALLDSDAFLCASNEPSVTKADFKGELYDKSLSYIRTMFLERPWLTWKQYRAGYSNETASPKTQIDRNKNAENLGFDEKTKKVGLVECWIKRDVLGWGRPQEFMLLLDPTKRKAIYYEFQAKLCPDLRDPYVAIAASPHSGYWWGYNLPEILKQFQDYADKQFNRHSARNERNANPIAVFWPDAVEEQPDDIMLGDGGLYRAKKTTTRADQFFQAVTIPNLDMDTQELLNFVTQWVQRWLGVSDISQGDYSDVKDNATLGGIKATLANGSKTGRRYERRIRNGYVDIILKMVELQCDQLDRAEVYEVSDGESITLATMTPEQLRGLVVHVSLIVGQTITEEDIKMLTAAKETVKEYFELPPDVRQTARPIYVKLLSDFGMKDAERLLPKDIPPAPAPETTKTAVNVTFKGETLPPNEQAVLLSKIAPVPQGGGGEPAESEQPTDSSAAPIPFPQTGTAGVPSQ